MRPNYISVLFLLTLLSAGFFYFSQKSNTSDIMVETEEENDQGEFLTPEHPLQIEYMRKQDYPGSDIIIEQTLSPESNYQRYIVSYQSEGLKQFALLTIPNGEAPDTGWPAILFNHGYINPSVYRTAEKYVAYTDYFSRNGYVLLKPDYRGNGNSEGDAEGGYGSPSYTIDVLNAFSSLKKYENVDPNRIGMWGHSMGGSITLRAMVVNPDIKAGVIWAGVVGSYPDLVYNWHRRSNTISGTPSPAPTQFSRRGRWRTELIEKYGDVTEDNPFWQSISPTSFLSEISGPLQLHHATGDSSVPVSMSEKLQERMEAVGKESELFIYQGDDHNISTNFSTAMQRSLAFFDKYVKGEQ